MDSGLEKTRRNLLIAVSVAIVSDLADVTWGTGSSGFFNFTVGNPEIIDPLLYLTVFYFWLRYFGYYIENDEGFLKILEAFDHRLKQVALKLASKKIDGYVERIEIRKHRINRKQIIITWFPSTSGMGRKLIWVSNDQEIKKDYYFAHFLAIVSFPFAHSRFFEKEAPLLSPLVLLLVKLLDIKIGYLTLFLSTSNKRK